MENSADDVTAQQQSSERDDVSVRHQPTPPIIDPGPGNGPVVTSFVVGEEGDDPTHPTPPVGPGHVVTSFVVGEEGDDPVHPIGHGPADGGTATTDAIGEGGDDPFHPVNAGHPVGHGPADGGSPDPVDHHNDHHDHGHGHNGHGHDHDRDGHDDFGQGQHRPDHGPQHQPVAHYGEDEPTLDGSITDLPWHNHPSQAPFLHAQSHDPNPYTSEHADHDGDADGHGYHGHDDDDQHDHRSHDHQVHDHAGSWGDVAL